jgi:hypothetical protein
MSAKRFRPARRAPLTASMATRAAGWKPTCKHGHDPTPCRILDPFAGSGTVGAVAERLGRHSVLIDAKEEYVAMCRERTRQLGLRVIT